MKRLFFIFLSMAVLCFGYVAAQVDDEDVITQVGKGFNSRGWLGIQLRDLKSEELSKLGDNQLGVAIDKVLEGTPAEKAGLKEGDIITHYAGIPVLGMAQFTSLVAGTTPGRNIRLDVIRGEAKMAMKAEIGEGKRDKMARRFVFPMPDVKTPDIEPRDFLGENEGDFSIEPEVFDLKGAKYLQYRSGKPRLGVEVENLTEQLAKYFNSADGGLLVRSVLSGSAAEKAGLKAGDVITAVDGAKVTDRRDLSRALDKTSGKESVLKIVRNGKSQDVRVTIDKPEKPTEGRRPAKL